LYARLLTNRVALYLRNVSLRATIADFDLCDQINSLDAVPACCHSQGMNARSWLQILLLSAVWGVSFLMIRIAGAVFPPFWVALLRCTLGAALMWAVLLLGGNKLPPRHLLPWLLAVAFFNNALPFTFFAWGERTVPSSLAAILNTTTPIWTMVMMLAIYKTRAAVLTIVGLLLGFGGVSMVVLSQAGQPAIESGRGEMMRGVLVISIAALSYAVATVMAKIKLKGLDPIGLATTQLTLAGLMAAPLALGGPHPGALHVAPVAAIAVLGFAGSGFAYLLYYRLLARVSAIHVTAVVYLMPLWGLFWGTFAHESIGLTACVGAAITIAGLVILNLPPRPAAAALRDCGGQVAPLQN
jgi:drug/metabolite transporter (DMT)-like permease